jgi:P27 family predicted phage terminase small subunit
MVGSPRSSLDRLTRTSPWFGANLGRKAPATIAAGPHTHALKRRQINFDLRHGRDPVRGRRPKPTALRELEGNPGKRPLNQHEPQPAGELFAAPEWMSESQREGWAWAITNAPHGLLKQLDRSMLAIWVVAEDLHREAAEKIAQYGLLTKSPNAGLPLQSPYLAILNKQAQIMIKAGAELGFSPASRTRVQVSPSLDSNPFARFRADPFRRKPWELPEPDEPDPMDRFFRD